MIFVDALSFLLKGYSIRRECWPDMTYINPRQPFFTFSVLDLTAGDWLFLDPKEGWKR